MTSSMKQFIRENVKKISDKGKMVQECVSRFHRTPHYITDTISELRRLGEIPANAYITSKGRPPLSVRPVVTSTRGKPFRMSVDVSEVTKEYDDEGKIQEALEALGTHIIKENDFRMELGISYERWKIISQMPKFVNNRQDLKGKRFRGIYWGAAAVIRELRKKIELV